MAGLREGRIAPTLWRECVGRLIHTAERENASLLFDAIAHSYQDAITDRRLEGNPIAAQQLASLHAILLDQSSDVAPHAKVRTRLLADLRAAIAKKRLGATGRRYATEFIADVEVTQGTQSGRPIDVAMLDELLQARDDSTLRRYALRLPDAALRSEARRRVVQLHIQQSPYVEVRENAVVVEEAVLRVGANRVATAEHRLLRGWIDAPDRFGRTVLVRQDIERQTSTLLGAVDDEDGVSVLPQLSLRGALRFELDGIDRPVTLCAPPDELDPSPCVPASEVRLDNRLAYLEPDGTIRFVEHLAASEVVALAARAERLVVPIIVRGRQLTALDWGLRFETPNDFVLTGQVPSAPGPDLRVRVEPLAGGRIGYVISRSAREYFAIVERDRANEFHVVSQGADGARGFDGSLGRDGLAGLEGTNASCPSARGTDGGRGADGSPGEDGGAGGAGGNGGDIVVTVAAGDRSAAEFRALIMKTVLSRGGSGGAGGSGGRGGRGGAGGAGGQGTSCVDAEGKTTYLSCGSPGLAGTDARDGWTGSRGSDGGPGRVTVRVIE
jgi:hypothetical protein